MDTALGIGIVMTSVFTLPTSLAANVSIWALTAVRVAEGFFEVSQRVKIPRLRAKAYRT